jgi:nucleoside 2-deoxyribosyltransferase
VIGPQIQFTRHELGPLVDPDRRRQADLSADPFKDRDDIGTANACKGEWLAWTHNAGLVANLLGKSPASASIESGLKTIVVGQEDHAFERAQNSIVGGLEAAHAILSDGAAGTPTGTVRRPAQIKQGTAFIAMPMSPNDPELDDVHDAIKQAAKECGITAERVDDNQTNEPITDRMLALIDAAQYVIVDLSRARPNVFYEAGYALGLGKIPVYVARRHRSSLRSEGLSNYFLQIDARSARTGRQATQYDHEGLASRRREASPPRGHRTNRGQTTCFPAR